MNMKNASTYILLNCLVVIVAMSCQPQEKKLDNPILPQTTALVEQLKPRITPSAENPNDIVFEMNEADGVVGVWLINAKYYPVSRVVLHYEFAGDYTAQAFAYNHNGTCSSIDLHFSVAQNDKAACSNSDYTALTGGCEVENGKTWKLVVWSYGEVDTNNSYENTDLPAGNSMDDEMTFILNADKTYRHQTNGTADFEFVFHEVPDYEASWELYEAKGQKYLTFTQSGFMPPHATLEANNNNYLVLELTENKLFLKLLRDDTDANAFYYTYVPK